ncbi:DUF3422 family protein [Colwellia maritima]|uniref:DUF3422 family protein n=1 Tax=Colwellia maritima TaxID=2912588 RepID=UPI00237B6BA7|nr:DUF3422 family protein [Colwellia maritima]
MLPSNTSEKIISPSAPTLTTLSNMTIHPLREKLYSELHNRPFRSITNPAQITHIAIQHEGKLKQKEHDFISLLCNRFQVSLPAKTMPCFYQNFGLFSLRAGSDIWNIQPIPLFMRPL